MTRFFFRMTPFQSTPPVRGATHSEFSSIHSIISFNPRPPCGERQSRIAKP
ncbi:Uncharacterized protein dnm_098740 [Desulfonema magnum]|uniref:Uncharacterized protein n=1 Tax=Desulfonema magnum TaxID=45655 RepID=A0A975BXW5_9BACT|nr:Uncharacterized protein dnm_098740 [Desulfonema magnum]